MWEEYEAKRGDKPYLWIVFFLFLLLLSSIFFLRPGIGTIPSGDLPVAKNSPVVTTIDDTAHGRPLFTGDANTGVWVGHDNSGRFLLRFVNALGDEQWAETIGLASPVVSSRGNYLVAAEVGKAQFFVYHTRQRLVHAITVPGELCGVSVSANGEVLATYVMPQADPLHLRTEVAFYSSLGQQVWRKTLDQQQPIMVAQSADGNTNAVLTLSLGSKVEGALTVFSRLGEQLFSNNLSKRPGTMNLRDDGERIAVALDNFIQVYDREGKLHIRYDAEGPVAKMAYIGRGSNLSFGLERKSLLNFRPHSHVGVLGDNGKLLWQYRSKERVTALGTANQNSNIFIGTGKGATLFTYDGKARWGLTHSFGEGYLVATLDGRHYLAVLSGGQVMQVRGD